MNARPKYDDLTDSDGNPIRASYSMKIHPNPKFYKYQWQIFHHGSPEGKMFFSTPFVCTFEAMALMDRLRDEGKGYLVYNNHVPRIGDDTPFNLEAECWVDITPAPSFEDDLDPEWRGHK